MSLDLGNGFSLRFAGWAPDRSLNPQYDDLPDCEKISAIVKCGPHGVEGVIHFKQPGYNYERLFNHGEWWDVEKWEPLTISPSVKAPCGCHGFIKEGKWVNA